MIGPLHPSPVAAYTYDNDDDDGVMMGPSLPPPSQDSDSEDVEEEEENRYRTPMSYEIVLKGHIKVTYFLSLLNFNVQSFHLF